LDAERRLKENTEITVRRIKSLEKQLRARLEVEKQTRLQFEAAEIEQAAGTRTLRELIDIRLEFEQAGLEVIRTRYDSLRQRLQLLALTAQLPI
jgi:outer membrane protein TolC